MNEYSRDNRGRYSSRHAAAERQRAAKRKRTTIFVSLALVGLLLVGGTVAWIATSTKDVKNTFTPSHVASQVSETFNGSQKTNVAVTNVGDTDSYIRIMLVASWVMEQDGKLVTAPYAPVAGTDYSLSDLGSDWIADRDNDMYYYTKIVKPGDSTQPAFETISGLDVVNNEGYSLSIEIIASSIQAKPETVVEGTWGVDVTNGVITSLKGRG